MRALTLFVLLSVAPQVHAQGRSLYWRELHVAARLDAEGRLHVTEEQAMVFSGDWNGGERRFRLGLGQEIELHAVRRFDPATGARKALIDGDLDYLDHYDWVDGRTLRWRSRLPSDPPFERTQIVYTLEYTLSHILIPQAEGYLLDHDFAFPDRDGVIERFVLDLELEPVWEPRRVLPPRYEAHDLRPGEGFVLRIPLRHLGGERPAAVRFGAPGWLRYLLFSLALGAVVWMGAVLYRRERGLGRFEPLLPTRAIDEAWLEENLLKQPPEVVGAAWDHATGSAEVAAVLARMTAEGKLASEVRQSGRMFSRPVLHLRLLAERETLTGYEKSLVQSLFFDGDETDTDEVREHYKGRGFDPSSKIAGPVDQRKKRWLGRRTRDDVSASRTLSLLGSGILVCVLGGMLRTDDLVVAAVGAGVGFVLFLVGAILAAVWSKRVDDLAGHALGFLAAVVILLASLGWLLGANPFQSGFLTLAGLTLLVLGYCNSVFNQAKTIDSAAAIRLRKRLAAARRYFQEELGRPSPRIRDEWYPYLIAFGLGAHMDRWFSAYGGGGAPSPAAFSGSSSSSARSGSGAPFWSGGGAFGGGGAGRSWQAAAGGLAAGVSSSSSSSGGGGGGGSSGGGGGGGW